MSEIAESAETVQMPVALARAARQPGIGPFDKAFAVLVTGPQGTMNGVGRNISEGGMFVETREPQPIGSTLRVTFVAPELQTEISAVVQVRFQCFLNFADSTGDQQGLRGMGVKFVSFDTASARGAPVPVTQ